MGYQSVLEYISIPIDHRVDECKRIHQDFLDGYESIIKFKDNFVMKVSNSINEMAKKELVQQQDRKKALKKELKKKKLSKRQVKLRLRSQKSEAPIKVALDTNKSFSHKNSEIFRTTEPARASHLTRVIDSKKTKDIPSQNKTYDEMTSVIFTEIMKKVLPNQGKERSEQDRTEIRAYILALLEEEIAKCDNDVLSFLRSISVNQAQSLSLVNLNLAGQDYALLQTITDAFLSYPNYEKFSLQLCHLIMEYTYNRTSTDEMLQNARTKIERAQSTDAKELITSSKQAAMSIFNKNNADAHTSKSQKDTPPILLFGGASGSGSQAMVSSSASSSSSAELSAKLLASSSTGSATIARTFFPFIF